MKKKLKLRLWVKCVLCMFMLLLIVWFINWNKEQYDKCMEYTKGNVSICSKLND